MSGGRGVRAGGGDLPQHHEAQTPLRPLPAAHLPLSLYRTVPQHRLERVKAGARVRYIAPGSKS